jgi:hypothetical protein
MLRKLLKYDFRAMWKQFAFVWPAALVIGLLNRFTLFGSGGQDGGMSHSFVSILSIMFLVGVLTAMGVVTLIFTIQRFYKGLLGEEGYLMHTLPVKPWQLTASKLICSLAAAILSGLTAILTLALMVPWRVMFQDLFRLHEWKLIFQALAEYPDVVPYVIEFCFILLSYLILFIATLYLSMSIGHLFPKFRVLLSVVAYFVLQTLGRTVAMLVGRLLGTNGILGTNGTWFDFQPLFTNVNAHAQLWGLIGLALLGSAICLATVNWILGHKLNLE